MSIYQANQLATKKKIYVKHALKCSGFQRVLVSGEMVKRRIEAEA